MGAITLSEIGDKTQLLALALAAHYRKPIPIVLGILCATLLNHWLAAMLGYWINLSSLLNVSSTGTPFFSNPLIF